MVRGRASSVDTGKRRWNVLIGTDVLLRTCCEDTLLVQFHLRLQTGPYTQSCIPYSCIQVPNSKFTLKTAMHLYDLTEYELFHENDHDTKLLVAWNSKMVLLAFRGTSSMKNLFADLRIARIPHPPIRGRFMTTPLVHRGFLQTWHSNGLNHRVLELLRSIIKDNKFAIRSQNCSTMGCRDFEVLLTGHSLGGALATLAAYDIRMHLNVPPCKIDCYTFGAPRVGNYAFAYDYNALVPNTWHIINDQVDSIQCGQLSMWCLGLHHQDYEIAGVVQASWTKGHCQC